jgi:hypothetical protein
MTSYIVYRGYSIWRNADGFHTDAVFAAGPHSSQEVAEEAIDEIWVRGRRG